MFSFNPLQLNIKVLLDPIPALQVTLHVTAPDTEKCINYSALTPICTLESVICAAMYYGMGNVVRTCLAALVSTGFIALYFHYTPSTPAIT